jgi:hypothetical protein
MKIPTKKTTDLTIEYAQLFNHNDFGFITALNQPKPNWTTNIARPLNIAELIRLYNDTDKLIGVGFGKKTKYATIDLDLNSAQHPRNSEAEFKKVLNSLERVGLVRYIVLQSSNSGGIHIYFPLPGEYNTYHVAALIQTTLIDAGFKIATGQIEIFPNCKSYASTPGEYIHYKRHRLPLQPASGSYLLTDDGLNPQSLFATIESQLGAFMNQWKMAAAGQDQQLLEKELPLAYAKYIDRKNKMKYRDIDKKSTRAEEWEADLDLMTQTVGWVGNGQTYYMLVQFLKKGVVFLKLKGQALFDWMYQAITTAPGYKQYCRHQHEIEKLIWSWIRTNDRTGYYTFYYSHPDRSQGYMGASEKSVLAPRKANPANQQTADIARNRIVQAYASLKDSLDPGIKITQLREMMRRQVEKMSGVACGTATLQKSQDIWHPKHNQKNLTTLTEAEGKTLEPLSDKDSDQIDQNRESGDFQSQTSSQSQFDYPKISMICSSPLEDLNSPVASISLSETTDITQSALTNYTNHYNLRIEEVVVQPQGKFEVLGDALAKIAAVTALAFNMVTTTGVIQPEPSIAVESVSSPTTPQVAETNPIEDLQTHPIPAGVQVNSGFERRSTEPISSIIPPAQNTQAVKSETPPESDRQEQTAPTPPPNQPPSEQIANTRQAREARPQVIRSEHVREPSSISTPPNPLVKDNAQECDCPTCEVPTPASELERWSMCRFCATKILFKRTI